MNQIQTGEQQTMAKANKTDITFLLDSSGSMHSLLNAVKSGLNEFLEQQTALDETDLFTLVTFHGTPIKATPLKYVEPFSFYMYSAVTGHYSPCFPANSSSPANSLGARYTPQGMTPLYDTICNSIDELGQRLSDTPDGDRPNKILFVIMTDGEENNSRHTLADVQQRIQHQTSVYSWEFMFLGNSKQLLEEAQSWGIAKRNTLAYSSSEKGTKEVFDAMSRATTAYRAS
jgi:uncharacterized protein YegL